MAFLLLLGIRWGLRNAQSERAHCWKGFQFSSISLETESSVYIQSLLSVTAPRFKNSGNRSLPDQRKLTEEASLPLMMLLLGNSPPAPTFSINQREDYHLSLIVGTPTPVRCICDRSAQHPKPNWKPGLFTAVMIPFLMPGFSTSVALSTLAHCCHVNGYVRKPAKLLWQFSPQVVAQNPMENQAGGVQADSSLCQLG